MYQVIYQEADGGESREERMWLRRRLQELDALIRGTPVDTSGLEKVSQRAEMVCERAVVWQRLSKIDIAP